MTANARQNDVAIIGFSGRFPSAPSPDRLWDNLRSGIEGISFFSTDELIASGVPEGVVRDPAYVKAKGIIQNVEYFDAEFFGISNREAAIIDPQHRVFLECCWEALESAGCDPRRSRERIAVYGGAGVNTYLMNYVYPNLNAGGQVELLPIVLGNDKDTLTMRVSHKLGLCGPSVTVQTACSTSLVAVHMATQSLLTGECDIALAGGVSIQVPQKIGYQFQEGGIVSHDGHCRAFDVSASGTVPSSGAGVVVLQRFSDAETRGNHVHAIIKGSAVNNDGNRKIGFTAPSIQGQADVIEDALAAADLTPDTISYIEAHGTGTQLGDPLEIAALKRVFESCESQSCALGSIKTSIGHLDAAAGVAGLIAVVLALKHKAIYPTLHFSIANPKLDLGTSPFFVNTSLTPWSGQRDAPRRAGVSSFGLGGTNAHVIVEEAPRPSERPATRNKQLLLVSAKTGSALSALRSTLAKEVRTLSAAELADVAFTLQTGRQRFDHRDMVVVDDGSTAAELLSAPQKNAAAQKEQSQSDERAVAFFLSDESSKYSIQASGELWAEQVFRDQVEHCLSFLPMKLQNKLLSFFDGRMPAPEQASMLDDCHLSAYLTIVIEYSVANMLMTFGLVPCAVLGRGIGECAAACLGGILSLREAFEVIERYREPLWRGRLNSAPLEEEDESAHLAGAQRANLTAGGTMGAPVPPVISMFTGEFLTAKDVKGPNWARSRNEPAEFGRAIEKLTALGSDFVILELGSGLPLRGLFRRHFNDHKIPTSMNIFGEDESKGTVGNHWLNAIGRLWLCGVELDWVALHKSPRRIRPLPTYPFERTQHWIEAMRSCKERPEEKRLFGCSHQSDGDSRDAVISLDEISQQIGALKRHIRSLLKVS